MIRSWCLCCIALISHCYWLRQKYQAYTSLTRCVGQQRARQWRITLPATSSLSLGMLLRSSWRLEELSKVFFKTWLHLEVQSQRLDPYSNRSCIRPVYISRNRWDCARQRVKSLLAAFIPKWYSWSNMNYSVWDTPWYVRCFRKRQKRYMISG